MGNEGIEDQNDRKLAVKGGHKQHRHHSQSHKHRKNKVHRNSVSTSEKDGLQKVNRSLAAGMLKPLISDKYREFPRGKRSVPDVSQWQKILDVLKQEKIGVASHSNIEESNIESDAARQVEILEEIEHQLEKEVFNSESARHGHHRQHPSIDVEAKKEEIQVLKEIEDSLQQTPPTEDNHATITGAHTHSSSHHHKHGQLHGGSKPLNDANNQVSHALNSHGHSKTHTETKPNLDELEEQVFKDILEAESDGLTKKQGIQLEREIENLEEIEKQTTEDLIKNSGPQTK